MRQLFNKMTLNGSKYVYYQRIENENNSLPVVRFDKQAFFKKAKKYQDICFGILAVYFLSLLIAGEAIKHFGTQSSTKKENAVIIKKPFVTKKSKFRRKHRKEN